ncbi:MAG: GIY-YIG nuclease family protein [Melioribacter sp.]|nr:GIY-YIG nuclease family protein [Melioribacter sp.]
MAGESDRRLKSYFFVPMFYVYVLKSLKDYKRYIGFTENLQRRLFEHNNGLVKSTKNRRPLELIYLEEFISKKDALLREKFLKSTGVRAYLFLLSY